MTLYTLAAHRLAAYRAAAVKNATDIHTRPHLAGRAPEYLESTWPTSALAIAREAGAFKRRHAGNWADDRRAYYADSFPSDWRTLGRADEVSRREGSRRVEASGWYTQPDDYSQTLAGYVLQIPARNGAPQYVPATSHSDWDGVTIYPGDRYDSALDAAGAADRYAEREAEKEREYQTAWQAGHRWATLGEEVKAARASALEILKARKTATGSATLCDVIREKVDSLVAEIRRARDARDTLAKGDAGNLCFYPGEARLRDAFNEGAGAPVLA